MKAFVHISLESGSLWYGKLKVREISGVQSSFFDHLTCLLLTRSF